MSLIENSLSLSKNSSITEALEESSDSEPSISSNLINQVAIMVIGVISVMFMYRLLTRNLLINRVSTKGVELSRACYQKYQHFRLSNIIKNNIAAWENLLDQFKQKKSLSKSISTKKDTSLKSSKSYQSGREHFSHVEPAAAKVILDVFTRYIPKGSVLELGSNILNENGESYLARLLPKDYLSDLKYSDYSMEIVKRERKKTRRYYLYLDATRLREVLPAASETNIVAINVMDTILRSKLNDVANETHSVLRDNGNLVILCDQPFEKTPLISKFSTEDNLLFPYIDGNNLGLQIVSKEILMRHIQSFGQPFIQFIHSLMELPQMQRANFLYSMFAICRKLKLCDVLENICKPEDYQRIDHKQSYIKDLTEAFTSHGGFEIVMNDYVEGHVLASGSIQADRNINVIGADLRIPQRVYGSFNPNLKKNEFLIKSVFHVMIVRKLTQHNNFK